MMSKRKGRQQTVFFLFKCFSYLTLVVMLTIFITQKLYKREIALLKLFFSRQQCIPKLCKVSTDFISQYYFK